VPRFPIRRNAWTWPILAALGGGSPYAEVGDGVVRAAMGWHGRAEIPVARIDRLSTMHWPWWGGVGVRIARGLVAYVGAPGELVIIDLDEPLPVRAPLSWKARRIGIGVTDPDAFMAAVAEARRPSASA
jgi:hypothetical protein